MTTHADARQSPPVTPQDAIAGDTPLNLGVARALASPTRGLIAASLAIGVVFGFGGNFLPPTLRTVSEALSSIGLVVGSVLLALAFLRQSREVAVVAGLFILAIAEIVLWNNGRNGELAAVAFATAVMFYVPALLLISLPAVFPVWSRAAGALAALLFGAHAAQFLLGNTPSPSGPFAIAGYTLMSIAIAGWVVALLRQVAFSRVMPPLIGASTIALVLGCQMAAPPPTSTAGAQAAAPRVVEFNATDYAFSAPETLPAGLVTIRLTNHGQGPHHAQFLRLNAGVTFDQFSTAVQQQGPAALRLGSAAGGPGTIDPLGTSEVTLDLTPGMYELLCMVSGPDGIPHLMKGMLKPLQVVEPSTSAAPPDVRGTFTMKDFSFDMPDVLPAGTATYKVVNVGPQMHELNVLRLSADKTVEDVLAWEQAHAGPPPFELAGGMNAFSPTGSGYLMLDLQPGTYAAICDIKDPNTGVPHSHLGMLKQFIVQG